MASMIIPLDWSDSIFMPKRVRIEDAWFEPKDELHITLYTLNCPTGISLATNKFWMIFPAEPSQSENLMTFANAHQSLGHEDFEGHCQANIPKIGTTRK